MIESLGDNLIPVMGIGCAFLFVTIWVIAATVDSIYKASINARLKERMMERGYSASEIERIVSAGVPQDEDDDDDSRPHRKPVPPVKPRQTVY